MSLYDQNTIITGLSNNEAMEVLAKYIDNSLDTLNLKQAKHALELCEDLSSRVEGKMVPELFYFRANAWSVIREIKHQDESNVWQWNQPELLEEIYWLRSAIQSESFSQLDSIRQCQILINTGNIVNHIGRPIEAIEYWQRALNILPRFGMALGNLGSGYEHYAKILYDRGHAAILFKKAHDLLRKTSDKGCIWDSYEYKSIQDEMLNLASHIKANVNFNDLEQIPLEGFSLGKSKIEKRYRKWVLENTLFINPLNDVGAHTIAAQDVLHLPGIVTNTGDPPELIGFYNQIKQEFVTARYLLWKGFTESEDVKRHYSDNNVLLINTLDYPVYGIAIEQIKLAFRSAYSLFDKIALFINDYWQLDIPEKKINFQSVWFEFKGGQKSKELNPKFLNHTNLMLRGLYWLSKDFIEYDSSSNRVLGKTMEPDAYLLRSIRNDLEHKYLKVHDDIWSYAHCDPEKNAINKTSHHISTTDLTSKTLRLMKLARAALIYLSLAIHIEEKMNDNERSGLFIPIVLPNWP